MTTETQLAGPGLTSQPIQGAQTMRAARYHEIGRPFTVDVVERPTPGADDVLIEVKACGLIPNFQYVLEHLPPQLTAPEAPAVYGLDPVGVVAEIGSRVHGLQVGERVYVNPQRSCGNCRQCKRGLIAMCDYMALNGYFGAGSKSAELMRDHPRGGFTEYITAPPSSLVTLPEEISFETAARWGYLGTGYAALRRGQAGQSTTVLVNGATGTLGVGTVAWALAFGAPTILAVGRRADLLERVKALAPERIHTFSVTEDAGTVADWARAVTQGNGADVVVDALPSGTPGESFSAAFAALARGGNYVNSGGVLDDVPINVFNMTNEAQTLMWNFWFSTEQGQEMARLAADGTVDLSFFEHRVFSLEQINEAMAAIASDHTGFANYVISLEETA